MRGSRRGSVDGWKNVSLLCILRPQSVHSNNRENGEQWYRVLLYKLQPHLDRLRVELDGWRWHVVEVVSRISRLDPDGGSNFLFLRTEIPINFGEFLFSLSIMELLSLSSNHLRFCVSFVWRNLWRCVFPSLFSFFFFAFCCILIAILFLKF